MVISPTWHLIKVTPLFLQTKWASHAILQCLYIHQITCLTTPLIDHVILLEGIYVSRHLSPCSFQQEFVHNGQPVVDFRNLEMCVIRGWNWSKDGYRKVIMVHTSNDLHPKRMSSLLNMIFGMRLPTWQRKRKACMEIQGLKPDKAWHSGKSFFFGVNLIYP